MLTDFKTKQELTEIASLKQRYRNEKIKEFLFANSSKNLILQDLQAYKNQLNFDVQDLSVLANGEGENAIEAKIKSKILKLMEKNVNYEKSFSCVSNFMSFLNRQKSFKIEDSRLFDYFLKQDKNTANLKLVLQHRMNKKTEYIHKKGVSSSLHVNLRKESPSSGKNKEKTENFDKFQIEKTTQKKEDKISKKRSFSLHNLNLIQTKDSFLPMTDRNTLSSYREKVMKNTKREQSSSSMTTRANRSEKSLRDLLPLKYKTQRILEESNRKKKLRGFTESRGYIHKFLAD